MADDTLARQFISNKAKSETTEDPSARTNKIVRKVVRKAPSQIRINLRREDLNRARRNSYASRWNAHPQLPQNIEETQEAIGSMDLKTADGENLVLVNCQDKKISIFGTLNNLKFLCTMLTLFVDGTFSYCPKFFKQLFTIFGIKNGIYIPLVFCLLPSKNTEDYSGAFSLIKQKCVELGVAFRPTKIVVDYEAAIHLAIKQHWLFAEITGCRFHLAQAWFRKIQELGK